MTAYLEPYIGSTEFVVFTGRACPYCVGATRWLEARALAFVEVDIDELHLRRPIVEDTGHRTVPASSISGIRPRSSSGASMSSVPMPAERSMSAMRHGSSRG